MATLSAAPPQMERNSVVVVKSIPASIVANATIHRQRSTSASRDSNPQETQNMNSPVTLVQNGRSVAPKAPAGSPAVAAPTLSAGPLKGSMPSGGPVKAPPPSGSSHVTISAAPGSRKRVGLTATPTVTPPQPAPIGDLVSLHHGAVRNLSDHGMVCKTHDIGDGGACATLEAAAAQWEAANVVAGGEASLQSRGPSVRLEFPRCLLRYYRELKAQPSATAYAFVAGLHRDEEFVASLVSTQLVHPPGAAASKGRRLAGKPPLAGAAPCRGSAPTRSCPPTFVPVSVLYLNSIYRITRCDSLAVSKHGEDRSLWFTLVPFAFADAPRTQRLQPGHANGAVAESQSQPAAFPPGAACEVLLRYSLPQQASSGPCGNAAEATAALRGPQVWGRVFALNPPATASVPREGCGSVRRTPAVPWAPTAAAPMSPPLKSAPAMPENHGGTQPPVSAAAPAQQARRGDNEVIVMDLNDEDSTSTASSMSFKEVSQARPRKVARERSLSNLMRVSIPSPQSYVRRAGKEVESIASSMAFEDITDVAATGEDAVASGPLRAAASWDCARTLEGEAEARGQGFCAADAGSGTGHDVTQSETQACAAGPSACAKPVAAGAALRYSPYPVGASQVPHDAHGTLAAGPAADYEIFYIAETVEDYLRLGALFRWVYGWQLCYASSGPPRRALPWLRLLCPQALAVAMATVKAAGTTPPLPRRPTAGPLTEATPEGGK